MSPEAVQAILADFQRHARRVGARRADGRETWRFDVSDHAYSLHFYPEDDTALRRYVGGGDAAREFQQLQALQKLTIPAARVIATLKGFRLGDRKGDACIVVHDPADVPLNSMLRDGVSSSRADHLQRMAGLFTLLESLHREKLCPTPLQIGSFARRADRTILADGSVKLAGIVDAARLTELDQSTRHVTTAGDRLRTWRHFRDDAPPRHDRALRRLADTLVADARHGERHFGTIEHDGWIGRFLRQVPLTLPWSRANALEFDAQMWRDALPQWVDDATRGESLKDDHAASIRAGEIQLAGETLQVVVKRLHAKPGVFRSLRRSRAMRSWLKTWRMLGLGFACEVPLLVMERRRTAGVEQLLVVERVPGPTLAKVDLAAMPAADRASLLYSAGRTLRLIERHGFTHCDAKSTNWMVWTDHAGRPRPILIDLDGVRFYRWRGMGVERLLRAMKTHPQITDIDLATVQRGYHP